MTTLPRSTTLNKRSPLTEEDKQIFDQALDLRNAEDLVGALVLIEELATRHPTHPSIIGVLAALLWQVGNIERCVQFARVSVGLSPTSELASLTLVHALRSSNREDSALEEVSRFRSIRPSAEYDRLLGEWENETLQSMIEAPLDPIHRKRLDAVRAELRARPIRQ
ncbi:MAG: hypothetical protein JST00_42035 [Deltaproteobacteria bacterium]|nr:hypothetical protein [Deltaproteobacteria bacterium]